MEGFIKMTSMFGTPSAEIEIDALLVSRLLAEQQVRQQAIESYGNLSEATLARARGWAIFFGVVLLDSGLVDHPQHAEIGQKILQSVVC
jgi:hypothetical protein